MRDTKMWTVFISCLRVLLGLDFLLHFTSFFSFALLKILKKPDNWI